VAFESLQIPSGALYPLIKLLHPLLGQLLVFNNEQCHIAVQLFDLPFQPIVLLLLLGKLIMELAQLSLVVWLAGFAVNQEATFSKALQFPFYFVELVVHWRHLTSILLGGCRAIREYE